MKCREDIRSLVMSLRHIESMDGVHRSELLRVARVCWENTSRVSFYAQTFAEPYGDDDISAAAAEVIAESARVKLELITVLMACFFPKSLRLRYTQRAFLHYQRLRDAAGK